VRRGEQPHTHAAFFVVEGGLQQVRGKTVAQGVGRGWLVDARSLHGLGHKALDAVFVQVVAPDDGGARAAHVVFGGKEKLPAQLPRRASEARHASMVATQCSAGSLRMR
jgi:hypothetical protein